MRTRSIPALYPPSADKFGQKLSKLLTGLSDGGRPQAEGSIPSASPIYMQQELRCDQRKTHTTNS